MHGHTYAGNPLAAAAALATLDILQQDQILEKLPAKFDLLAGILQRIAEHPRVAETRQMGLIAAVELTPSGDPKEHYPAELRIAQQVCDEALRRGVWLRPLGDVLVIMPPLSISDEQLQFLGDVLLESILAVTAAVAESQRIEGP